MYYVVTEGRARMLDRLSLMDRSTYGVDWMVMKATSARDAVRQWNLFKAGTHPAQGRLELEAARHRTSTPGYTPAWEAESQIISSDIAETLDSVEDRQRELAALRGELSQIQGARAAPAGGAGHRRGAGGAGSRPPRRARPGRSGAGPPEYFSRGSPNLRLAGTPRADGARDVPPFRSSPPWGSLAHCSPGTRQRSRR